MARETPIQHSFNAGEWSPRMFGRTDLDKYRAAARLISNWQLIPQGGLVRRSGTRFASFSKNSATETARLVPFVFSDTQAYVLEIGDRYTRFHTLEGSLRLQILTPVRSADLNAITDLLTITGHGYSDGDGVIRITSTGNVPAGLVSGDPYFVRLPFPLLVDALTGVDTVTDDLIIPAGHTLGSADNVGPYQLEAPSGFPSGLLPDTDYFIDRGTVSDTRFGLSLIPGGARVNIIGTNVGLMTLVPSPTFVASNFWFVADPGDPPLNMTDTGTLIHTVTPDAVPAHVELATPWNLSELAALNFTQSADVLTIVHPDHRPQTISRISAQGFVLDDAQFTDGPYGPENATAITITPSATSGVITLSATAAIFSSLDVGRDVRLRGPNHWGYATISATNSFPFSQDLFHAGDIFSIDLATDIITTSLGFGFPMTTGTPVRFSGGTIPPGLVEGQLYFVHAKPSPDFSIHDNVSDAAADLNRVDITGPGAGTVNIIRQTVLGNPHGFTGNEGPVRLVAAGATIIPGLFEDTDYFIYVQDATNFGFSEVAGQNPVGPTAREAVGTLTMHGGTLPATIVTAIVKADFEDTSATTAWRRGVFGGPLGQPSSIVFHEARLWLAIAQTLFASKTNDFNVFSPSGDIIPGDIALLDDTVDPNNAITYELSSQEVNIINWLHSARTLVAGTLSDNWTIESGVSGEALGPLSIVARPTAEQGGNIVPPVRVGSRTVYVSTTGRKLFSLGYSFATDNYEASDLTLFAEHITGAAITDLTNAPEPGANVFAVREDGKLAALTLIRDQEIEGWSRHVLGGAFVAAYSFTFTTTDVALVTDSIMFTASGLETGQRVRMKPQAGATLPAPFLAHRDYYVRADGADLLFFYNTAADARNDVLRIDITTVGVGISEMGTATDAVVENVAAIPSPAGDPTGTGRTNLAHDQVWMLVKRTINGLTVRSIEFMEDLFEASGEAPDKLEDAYFLDCGLTYNDPLTPITVVTGLIHLAGEFVDVLADGVVYLDLQVSQTGTITIDVAAVKIHIGFGFSSDFRSLRRASGDLAESSETKRGRTDAITLRLDQSLGGKYGPTEDDLLDMSDELLPFDLLLDTIPPLFTDDIELPFEGPWDTYGEIYIRQDIPLPFSLIALLPAGQRDADTRGRQRR